MNNSLLNEALEAAQPKHEETCERTETDETCSMIYYGTKIVTVEDLLKSAGVDLTIWEVVRQTVNNWEVAGKFKSRDSLWKTGLRQIKVELKRRAPKIVQDGIRDLMGTWKPWRKLEPVKKVKKQRDRHLLGIYLYDSHFGKYCWAPQSGDNYDLSIAASTFQQGFSDLLGKSLKFTSGIDEIWFPIGNDFFHVNDWQSRTVNETRVESTDDRFPKVFRVGAECVINSVKELADIAPVKLIWIPGNHDFHTSWHLATLLEYAFAENKRVTVDASLRARKYHRYGCTLVGMCHGEKVKENQLPTLMSSEARHLIDENVKFREWHLGHLHVAREVEFRTQDSLPNTIIRRLPSLCGTDGWHDQQGFVDSYKMAEAYLWSFDRGPQAKFVTHASSRY